VNCHEQNTDSALIKNGKYFVLPQNEAADLKAVLKRLVAAGAGRPVDRDGFPAGPWTAELLADAISGLASSSDGIEVRTVQHWLQDNDRGIRAENIRLLARIFGCGDPEATIAWQKELGFAQERLARKRRAKLNIPSIATTQTAGCPDAADPERLCPAPDMGQRGPDERNLAQWSEALFTTRPSLTLPAMIWAGWIMLGFLAYILGLHDVTYQAGGSVPKQVGFFWAPNWTVLELVILPLFLVTVIALLDGWKTRRRLLVSTDTGLNAMQDWSRLVGSFNLLSWTVFCICFLAVFVLQWSGVHLRALITGHAGNLMIDWNLIALVEPGSVSVVHAAVLSGFAFFYTACICFLFLTGLILMLVVVQDFAELSARTGLSGGLPPALGTDLLRRIFRATILGIWIATCIKLQAVYLLSDAPDILAWFFGDARYALGLQGDLAQPLSQRAAAHFTSFLLLFATVLVFAVAFVVFGGAAGHDTEQPKSRAITRWTWLAVIAALVANFFLIGQFPGFSLLLAANIFMSVICLVDLRSPHISPRPLDPQRCRS
jgi:hypothetical protein